MLIQELPLLSGLKSPIPLGTSVDYKREFALDDTNSQVQIFIGYIPIKTMYKVCNFVPP